MVEINDWDATSDLSAQEAFERFEMVWSYVECGISLIDAETRRIIDINPVAARMFGADKSEIIGRKCHKFLCPAEEHACPIMDKNMVVDRSERKFIKADGTIIPIIKSVAKITLNGRLTLLESFTDLSNLKEAEEKLRLMEVAEQANKAKTDFLSHISHEMRTPMNAIIGMTAIGKSSDNIDRKDYALDKIEEASSHLLAIINDVLDMAKIESGKFDLSLTEFSFERMLQRVVDVMFFRIDEKKHHFSLHIDENIPPIMLGDDQRLAQVITNLLANAVKFTSSEGFIHVEAKLLKSDNGMCTIQIEVSDTGIGISPEAITRLFQSFEQADTSTVRKYGGTGLGLSISKNIVEMMDGDIWVESEPGRGSTFFFTVQMRCGSLTEFGIVPCGAVADETDATNPATFEGKQILLAEDVEINREIVLSLLESTLVEIDCAMNGAEAVELFKKTPERYDMILMDVMMPDVDGFEATRQIRALDFAKAKEIPIIAMTANVFREDVDRCLAAGMNDHIGKPIEVSTLLDKLQSYL